MPNTTKISQKIAEPNERKAPSEDIRFQCAMASSGANSIAFRAICKAQETSRRVRVGEAVVLGHAGAAANLAVDFDAGLRTLGTPTGIDVRKVVGTGVVPPINTAIAHRSAHRMIGAGIATPSLQPFADALVAFGDSVIGEPLREMLDRERTAARKVAENTDA